MHKTCFENIWECFEEQNLLVQIFLFYTEFNHRELKKYEKL